MQPPSPFVPELFPAPLRLMDIDPALSLGLARQPVLLALDMRQLAQKLHIAAPSIGIEHAGIECVAHRAARLIGVAAVVESASLRETLNVLEGGPQPLLRIDQAELA